MTYMDRKDERIQVRMKQEGKDIDPIWYSVEKYFEQYKPSYL